MAGIQGTMSSKYALPKSQVQKIIREALPPQQTHKSDYVDACSKAAVIFIMYLTATANESKKTLDDQAVIQALKEMGFPQWEDDIKTWIEKMRE